MIDEIRALPNAIGPEKSILSSMFQEPDEYLDLATELGLTADDFYVPAHATLYKILQKLHDKGDPIELVTVNQTLKDNDLLENLGGPTEITRIFTYAPTAAHFKHHLEVVLGKSKLRKVISYATSAIAEAYQEPENISAFIDSVESSFFSINQARSDEIPRIGHLVETLVDNLEKRIKGEVVMSGIMTRFALLNSMTGGFKPGELIIIAARPSVGKTALMCNMLEDFAMADHSGLCFTLEMDSQKIVDRIVFSRAKFNEALMNKAEFSPTREELRNIFQSTRDVIDKNLFIDDTSAIHIDEMRAKARRKKQKEGIEFVAIDYLQLMRADRKHGREREVADMSAGCKALAKELGIPVIVLAQLNRGVENRSGNIPRLSDLRESGAIEQDADKVIFIHREDEDASLILDKNRQGPTGTESLKFNKETMTFS